MPQKINPSPLTFRVRDMLTGKHLTEENSLIHLLPDGSLIIYELKDTGEGEPGSFESKEIGDCLCDGDISHFLLPSGAPRFVVERGTGEVDKDRKEIFEGDIIQYSPKDPAEVYSFFVKWEKGSFLNDDGDNIFDFISDEIVIIGNIHDAAREEKKNMATRVCKECGREWEQHNGNPVLYCPECAETIQEECDGEEAPNDRP